MSESPVNTFCKPKDPVAEVGWACTARPLATTSSVGDRKGKILDKTKKKINERREDRNEEVKKERRKITSWEPQELDKMCE